MLPIHGKRTPASRRYRNRELYTPRTTPPSLCPSLSLSLFLRHVTRYGRIAAGESLSSVHREQTCCPVLPILRETLPRQPARDATAFRAVLLAFLDSHTRSSLVKESNLYRLCPWIPATAFGDLSPVTASSAPARRWGSCHPDYHGRAVPSILGYAIGTPVAFPGSHIVTQTLSERRVHPRAVEPHLQCQSGAVAS